MKLSGLKTVVIGLAALGCASAGYAEEWSVITDRRNVLDLAYQSDKFWLATSGGLSSFDTTAETFRNFGPPEGFAGTLVAAMGRDSSDGLWLAFDNRMLQRFDLQGETVTHSVAALTLESRIIRINSIAVGAEELLAATNRGIARVVYNRQFDRWVWLEEWTVPGDSATALAVKSVTIDGENLWALTADGISRGTRSEAGVTWRRYGAADGLRASLIRDVKPVGGTVYALTDAGVFEWDGTSRWNMTTGRSNLLKFALNGDSLAAIGTDGIYEWIDGHFILVTPPRNWLNAAIKINGRWWGGMRFTGTYRGGLAAAADTGWNEYIPDGPITDYVLDYAFLPGGETAITGGLATGYYGLSLWDGSRWHNWAPPTHNGRLFNYETRGVAADLDDGIWVGGFGGGLGHFSADGTVTLYNYSPETGRRLIGYPGNLDYVLTPAVATDGQGNIWVTNRGAENGNVLVCIPRGFIQNPVPEVNWIYFHRSLFRNYPHFDLLTIDGLGRKWLGSTSPEVLDGRGVYCFDDNGTIDDPADDRVWGPLPGLNYPQVFSLAYDPAGYVWVGGLDGAFYINSTIDDLTGVGFNQLIPMRDVQVKDVAVDVSGNKWFATDFGVSVIDPDLFTVVRRITAEPPDPLPSPQVQSVGINPVTGVAYIGTQKGTVALQTPYRSFGERMNELSFEPNPFNPNAGPLKFTGTSLAGRASVRVFTPDGRLVRRLSHEQAALGWDGLTDSGHQAADGVYIILAYNDRGAALTGKVAVIWR